MYQGSKVRIRALTLKKEFPWFSSRASDLGLFLL